MPRSRRKGAEYEREVAKVLRDAGLNARRGQQYSGANGDPDVVCDDLPLFHLELKRRKEHISAADMYAFMEQAKRDKRAGQMPVIVHRTDKHESLVTMRLSDWLVIVKPDELRTMEEEEDHD